MRRLIGKRSPRSWRSTITCWRRKGIERAALRREGRGPVRLTRSAGAAPARKTGSSTPASTAPTSVTLHGHRRILGTGIRPGRADGADSERLRPAGNNEDGEDRGDGAAAHIRSGEGSSSTRRYQIMLPRRHWYPRQPLSLSRTKLIQMHTLRLRCQRRNNGIGAASGGQPN